jgi:hypothetical protein
MAAARWWNRTAGERLIQEKPFPAFSRHNARYCSEIRLNKSWGAMTFQSHHAPRCGGDRPKKNQLS